MKMSVPIENDCNINNFGSLLLEILENYHQFMCSMKYTLNNDTYFGGHSFCIVLLLFDDFNLLNSISRRNVLPSGIWNEINFIS